MSTQIITTVSPCPITPIDVATHIITIRTNVDVPIPYVDEEASNKIHGNTHLLLQGANVFKIKLRG